MIEDNSVSNVIWGRVKYKWKDYTTYILLQEKITVYLDKPSETEWVPVGFDEKDNTAINFETYDRPRKD